MRKRANSRSAIDCDPFAEHCRTTARAPLHLLGGRFHFDSNSAGLLRLVDSAYAGLPRHRLPGGAREFRIRLIATPRCPAHTRGAPRVRNTEPAMPRMLAGAGMLGAAAEPANFVVLCPRQRAALVVVTADMLRFAYHTRYEWIEFAVFTLAARALGLVPLHAACVGRAGRGVLIVGPSGAGKSTLALLSALHGLDFLAEDSVFVTANTLLATGVANFLHVRADSLAWLGASRAAARIRRSPVIRRRSGIEKFEVDLRQPGYRLAGTPLRIVGVVFLSRRRAADRALLAPLAAAAAGRRIEDLQAYAAGQPQWREFARSLGRIGAYELARGRHPQASVDAIESLLQAP